MNPQVNIINGLVGGEDGGAERGEGKPDEIGAGDGEGCFSFGGDADETALTVEAGGDIEISVGGEGETLRAAEAAIPDAGSAMGVDGPDGVVGGERG
jgi:hypothetical protein